MGIFPQRTAEALERGRRFVTHDVWRVGRASEEGSPTVIGIEPAAVIVDEPIEEFAVDALWVAITKAFTTSA